MSEMTNLTYNLVNSVINKAKDYLGNKNADMNFEGDWILSIRNVF